MFVEYFLLIRFSKLIQLFLLLQELTFVKEPVLIQQLIDSALNFLILVLAGPSFTKVIIGTQRGIGSPSIGLVALRNALLGLLSLLFLLHESLFVGAHVVQVHGLV